MAVSLSDWSWQRTFDLFRAISEIFRGNNQSTKKTLINIIAMRLSGLQFKSDNKIKSKAIKFIVKKYCLIISNNRKALRQLQKILQTKIQVPEKLNKINKWFYQIVLFLARKNDFH